MPLVDQAVQCVWEELFQIQQQDAARAAILSVVPGKLLLDAPILPVQALSFAARAVIMNHTRLIQRSQHLFTEHLVDQTDRDVRGIAGASLATLADGEVRIFLRLPASLQNLATTPGSTRKQVQFEVLD